MKQEKIELIEPAMDLELEFIGMVREYITAHEQSGGWLFEQALDDFTSYVRKLLNHACGKNLPEDWVPESTYWLVRDNHFIVGQSSIRHKLTPNLEQRGGHVGYYVKPSERRKEYGTLLLKLTLEKARALVLRRVLITCDADNVASAKIILRNGGKLKDQLYREDSETLTSRYWIDLET